MSSISYVTMRVGQKICMYAYAADANGVPAPGQYGSGWGSTDTSVLQVTVSSDGKHAIIKAIATSSSYVYAGFQLFTDSSGDFDYYAVGATVTS
jgi:hypothetical protein